MKLIFVIAVLVLTTVKAFAWEFSIGIPASAYWNACDTEGKAVSVAEALVKRGEAAAIEVFQSTAGCVQFSEKTELFAHKVVWHRENHAQEIVKVVDMSAWKNGVPVKHYFVITFARVLGSGIEGSLQPLYVPVQDKKYPRTMFGLFCTTPESLRIVAENVPKMHYGALNLVNKEKIMCLWYPDILAARAIVESMKLVRVEYVTNIKLYLYEVTVSGFLFGNNHVKINPPMTQYLYMTDPQNPEDKGDDA